MLHNAPYAPHDTCKSHAQALTLAVTYRVKMVSVEHRRARYELTVKEEQYVACLDLFWV